MPSDEKQQALEKAPAVSELLATLQTTHDRELLRVELAKLKAAVFKVKQGTFEEVLKTGVRASVAEIIEREVRTTQQKPEDYLAGIEAQLDKAPVLQLTVAFEPTMSNLAHISQRAAEILGQNVLLEVVVKPEVVAGAVIVWNGRYHDASLQLPLAAAIQSVIPNAKPVILSERSESKDLNS